MRMRAGACFLGGAILCGWALLAAPPTEPEVSASKGESAFDFLLGEWEGEGSGGRVTATKVLDGPVIQERWEESAFSAVVLRSFGGTRWYLTFVMVGAPPQVWEGRWEEGRWRFYREWELQGARTISRTYWVPQAENGFVRTVEQSRDGGATWREHVRAVYRRSE